MTAALFCPCFAHTIIKYIHKIKIQWENFGEFGECFVFAKLKPYKFLHEMYIQNIASWDQCGHYAWQSWQENLYNYNMCVVFFMEFLHNIIRK